MAAATDDANRPTLSLNTLSGAPLLARPVRFGERFGPLGRNTYRFKDPAVEFLAPGARGTRHIAAYRLEMFSLIEGDFAPGGDEPRRFPAQEMRRLLAWLERPHAGDEIGGRVVLAGDRDAMGRVAVALARLRLRPWKDDDGVAALAQAVSLPPELVVVGDGIVRMTPLALVRRLRSEQRTWELPVLVLGGERDEAFAAGANAHLPLPFEPRELVERAAELVQLV